LPRFAEDAQLTATDSVSGGFDKLSHRIVGWILGAGWGFAQNEEQVREESAQNIQTPAAPELVEGAAGVWIG
jgi:hypothetical protein